MELTLHKFDPKTTSPQEWEKYHAFRLLRHQETKPDDEFTANELVEKSMKQTNPMAREYRFLVKDGNEVIGSLSLGVLREDSEGYEANKNLLQASGALLPQYRSKGLGDALLKVLYEIALKEDKSTIIIPSSEEAGIGYLKRIGAKVAMDSAENRLEFSEIDWELVESWVAEGEQRNPTTSLRTWSRIPDEEIDKYSIVLTEVNNQQPLDDMDVNDMIMSSDIIREREDQLHELGADFITMVTQEADGAISGLTEMIKIPGKKQLQQELTGVQEQYRGRGLGKWLKAAMLLYIRDKYPDTTRISTGNANSNAPMLSINERLGFKRHKSVVNAQITRDEMETYLNSREIIDLPMTVMKT